ncbi:MAG TPA: diacylglycerol kinase family protein [Chitinophagaceae bacterium]|nr:diacylglycerol kinase family protein [Chitinophagaceae bacterium]
MRRHIIYIVNPVSGTRDKTRIQQLIEKKMQQASIRFLIVPSVAGGDYQYVKALIREHGTTDVVIAGGDGTVSQVVGALCSENLNFGIIPCGSGNGVAYTMKIPTRAERALDLVIAGRSEYMDGFSVNGKFACMLCGLGFDARVAHDFANQPKRGLATYVRQVIRNFFSAKTYAFSIAVGEKIFSTRAYFLSIANSNQFGNNFRIAPRASMSDGLLDIVIVTDRGKIGVIYHTLRQISGRVQLQDPELIREKGVIYFQTSRLTIGNSQGAPLHIDGDPAESAEELEIEIRKRCFRLIQP